MRTVFFQSRDLVIFSLFLFTKYEVSITIKMKSIAAVKDKVKFVSGILPETMNSNMS